MLLLCLAIGYEIFIDKSLVMRKPALMQKENSKETDRPVQHPCTDRPDKLSVVYVNEIQGAGLSHNWWLIQKSGFFITRLII